MKRYEIIIFSVLLVLTGTLILLEELSLLDITIKEILIMDLFAFGALNIYIGLERGSRSLIIFSTSSFLVGVFLFILNNYEITNNASMYIFALLFISATNFLMLFLENPKSVSFFFSAILIYIVAVFSITILHDNYITYLANGFVKMLLDYWPLFLLFLGINILNEAKKK